MEDRARDVVRQVRDDVVRRRDERRSGPGRARRPRRAASRSAASSGRELVAEERRQAAVELDGRHRAPRRRAGRSVRRPSPGPISSTRRPGHGRRLGEDRLEDVGVGEEVLAEAVAGPEAGVLRSVRRTAPGRRGPAPGGRDRRSAPRGSARERQRRPRVEVEVGPLAGREPPGRRPRRSSPRCPCRAPGRGHDRAAAPSASASPASRVRSAPFAATPPPSTIDRAPDRLGRPDRLRRRARRRPRPGSPTASSAVDAVRQPGVRLGVGLAAGRQALAGPGRRRPSAGPPSSGPLKLKS